METCSASGAERLASRLRPGQERVSRACGARTFLKYSRLSLRLPFLTITPFAVRIET
jgi:hypothetical protein